MAQVDIVLNGRSYKITCEDGQEDRLQRLAGYLNAHVSEIAQDLSGIGEARILLLSALTICDELFETKAMLKAFEQKVRENDREAIEGAREALNAATARVHALTDIVNEEAPANERLAS